MFDRVCGPCGSSGAPFALSRSLRHTAERKCGHNREYRGVHGQRTQLISTALPSSGHDMHIARQADLTAGWTFEGFVILVTAHVALQVSLPFRREVYCRII